MSASDFEFRRWAATRAKAAESMSSPPGKGRGGSGEARDGEGVLCSTAASTPSPSASRPPLPLPGGEEKIAPDPYLFRLLDFAPPDIPGGVTFDPIDDVFTIHVYRQAAHASPRDLWLIFRADDAASLAARIAGDAGGDHRRAGLIAFAMVAWAGAIAGSLLIILTLEFLHS